MRSIHSMLHPIPRRPAAGLVASLALLAGLVAMPSLARAQGPSPMRHHVTIDAGYGGFSDGQIPYDGSTIGPSTATEFIALFDSGPTGAVSYGYSLQPRLDLRFVSRLVRATESAVYDPGTGPQSYDITLDTWWFGPGVRYFFSDGRIRPYGEALLLLASEKVSVDYQGSTSSSSTTGLGGGVAAGVDFRVSDLLSIPVEGRYLLAKPEDDISNWSLGAGLTFSFGTMP